MLKWSAYWYAMWIAALLAFPIQAVYADNALHAIQNRASTPNFQLILNLDTDGAVASSGSLFGPAGGVYGLTFLDGILYGVELDNSSLSDDFLATIPHEGPLVGQGARVGPAPIGFANVESLAAVKGVLYATSLDFAAHRTSLITINPGTGIGTLVGTGNSDVLIVGLVYDPTNEVLYGAGMPFGGVVTPNLYSINPGTGATTLIASLTVPIQSLAWESTLGLVGAFEKLYHINAQTGAATQLGTADFTDGHPATFNGIYALAALNPMILDPEPARMTSLTISGNDVVLVWGSRAGFNYGVQTTDNLTGNTWMPISGSTQTAAESSATYTHSGAGIESAGFYRIVTTVP